FLPPIRLRNQASCRFSSLSVVLRGAYVQCGQNDTPSRRAASRAFKFFGDNQKCPRVSWAKFGEIGAWAFVEPAWLACGLQSRPRLLVAPRFRQADHQVGMSARPKRERLPTAFPMRW